MPRSLCGDLMKKTQRKDARRNILRQIVSYLSIVVIAMLAVLAYLGINFASTAIAINGDDFYGSSNFRDIQIISTKLITPDDLELIRSVHGVTDVEGVCRTDGKIFRNGEVTDVMVVSLTERINTVQLIEGRLPTFVNECVIEKTIDDDTGLGIGDTLTVQNAQGETPDFLSVSEYVITGIVYHPDHACWPLMTPGPRYVIVMPEAFDAEALDNCYMTAEVTVDVPEGVLRFSDDYLDAVADTLNRLEALGEERALARTDYISGRYQSEIDAGQADLDEGASALADARADLDANWADYNAGVADLESAEQQLIDSQQQLDDAQIELQNGRAQLDDAASQLASGRAELDAAWAQLEAVRIQLEEAAVQLADGRAQLDQSEAQLNAAAAQLAAAEAQLSGGPERLAAAQAQLADGRAQLESGYAQIEDAGNTIRSSMRQAIINTLGPDIAARINWAEPSYSVNVDDPDASATMLPITQTITVNLNQSLGDNIFAAIAAQGIPESDLRAAYEATTGLIIDAAETRPVLQVIVDFVVAQYQGIDSRYEEFASAARSWDSGHSDYINGVNDYNNAQYTYNTGAQQYSEGRASYEYGLAQYQAGLEEYNARNAEYQNGLAQYQEGLARYNAGRYEYESNLADYQRGEADYQRGLRQYNEGVAALEAGQLQYEEGQQQLADALVQLEEGEAQYADGLAEYNAGAESLQSAVDQMSELDPCYWVVLDIRGNAGYLYINNGKNNVGDLGGTFALIFILVGALVIYATVGRIVDEQSRLVGATKALGFFNREILAKYMLFGVTGTVLGMLLGTLAGFFGIQRLVLYIYGRYYVFGAGRSYIDVILTSIVFAGGILLSTLTVWFACTSLMKSTAITLMQERVPSAGKKARKTKKNAGKGALYRHLILLNMLSDKKRVAVTIVSIAGCCALLVAGMTMSYAVKKSLAAQFSNIEVFDQKISFDPSISADAQDEIEQILLQEGASYICLSDRITTFEANGRLGSTELLCGDLNELNDYFIRRDLSSDRQITESGEGVWIHSRTAKVNGIEAGDTITLYDSAMNPHPVKVDGVYRIYAGYYSLMDVDGYINLFGEEPVNNAFLINLNGADPDKIASRLSGVDGFVSVTDTQTRFQEFKSLASVLDYLSFLFVGIAGMMAYFILLNLVNMYINQKKRELVIMRINGFTVKETIRFVSLELIVCTVIGIVLGLLFGSGLGYRIISLLEGANLGFIKAVQFESWGIAAGFTILFTVLISAWALRKVKNLKLTDVN